MQWISDVFDTEGFPARWSCGIAWSEDPWLGYVHILADLLTWGAYTAIPLVLAYFVFKRRDVPLTGIFWLFCAFIFACGTVHLIEATIFWWPVYRLSGYAKLVMAAVSWATVAALIPATPKALRLPGLAKINADLAREVEVRTRAERELAVANKELARKNQEIGEYVSIITHDLKHPAFSIQTLQGLLRRKLGDRLNAEDARFIDLSVSECERMMEMLGQLSSLARIERTQVRYEDVNLRAFCQRCVDRFRGKAEQLACAVAVDAPDETVSIPRQQVEECLNNLIDNALRYGCKGRDDQVELLARVEGGEAFISVRDNGPGIEPKHHDRIFQLFHRLNPDQSPGTGVGLAAVRRLMQHVGGDVALESSLGYGSRFTLRFGLHSSPAPMQGELSSGPQEP